MQAHMRAYTHARMQWTLAETCMRMELWRRSMSISSLRASSRAIADRIAASHSSSAAARFTYAFVCVCACVCVCVCVCVFVCVCIYIYI